MTDKTEIKAKTKLVKCEACKGKKELVGLGFTVKKCPTCKGIGYQEEVIDPIGYLEEKEKNIEEDQNKLKNHVENEIKEEVEKKKGRPKSKAK